MYRHKRQKSTKEKSVVSLKAAYEALAQLDDWNEKTLEDTMMALPAQLEVKTVLSSGQFVLHFPVNVQLQVALLKLLTY